MAERSIAAVLKTVEGYTSGGSNPSLSAETLHENISKARKFANSGMAGFFIFCLSHAYLDIILAKVNEAQGEPL
jgi:hypothetical protein